MLTEVSDGDGSVIKVSQNEMPEVSENEISVVSDNELPEVSENEIPKVSENAVPMVSGSDMLEYGDAAYISGDGNDVSGGEILYSGEEAGITWSITSDGLLTIGGEYDVESGEKVTRSWLDYKDEIKKAVVTAQKVENTASWFEFCTNLTEIDLSGLDTGSVTSMSYMFYDCSSLDISGLYYYGYSSMDEVRSYVTSQMESGMRLKELDL